MNFIKDSHYYRIPIPVSNWRRMEVTLVTTTVPASGNVLDTFNFQDFCFIVKILFLRNGSAVKIEIGMPPERVISTKFPKEYWKTFTALCFVLCNFLLTTVSLSITHELRRPELPPLPDITLDHILYRKWALDVSEILIMVSTITAAFFVVFHKYR